VLLSLSIAVSFCDWFKEWWASGGGTVGGKVVISTGVGGCTPGGREVRALYANHWQ
jgi:hypothetical protein